MCWSAFTWWPWFYCSPIANIAVMSMYRQSGGENAAFRTEVSIKHGVSAKEWLWLWLKDILRHNKPYRSNSEIPLRWCAQSLLTITLPFSLKFVLLFWKEIKTLKSRMLLGCQHFPKCQEFLENWHLWIQSKYEVKTSRLRMVDLPGLGFLPFPFFLFFLKFPLLPLPSLLLLPFMSVPLFPRFSQVWLHNFFLCFIEAVDNLIDSLLHMDFPHLESTHGCEFPNPSHPSITMSYTKMF